MCNSQYKTYKNLKTKCYINNYTKFLSNAKKNMQVSHLADLILEE